MCSSKLTYSKYEMKAVGQGIGNKGQERVQKGVVSVRICYLKDHLGSVRMTVDAVGNVVGYDDYYPYGMTMTGRSQVPSTEDSRYKFISKTGQAGKERDAETNLDYFACPPKSERRRRGARYYDSWRGQWGQVDPMADKYPGWSSYNYVTDNPIRNIDPDGNELDEFNVDKQNGTITLVSNKGGNKTDYYNIGTYDKKGNFSTQEEITIPREGGSINSFRFWESDKSTISVFNIPGTNIIGNILEPPGPSTSKANIDRRIPEGSYNLSQNSSGKEFPNNYKLSNVMVSSSRGILIHLGNFPKDTHGCLLPGIGWKPNYITGGTSQKMVLKINNYIKTIGATNATFNIFNIIQ